MKDDTPLYFAGICMVIILLVLIYSCYKSCHYNERKLLLKEYSVRQKIKEGKKL